jgi:hypothetical protein
MQRWMILLAGLGACAAGGHFQGDVCRLPSVPLVKARAQAARTRNLVLITVDGVRWQEIFGGAGALPCGAVEELLPNLHALGELGVTIGDRGAPVVSSGPKFVSLPGYREIMTGRASAACLDNDCGPLTDTTLLDELPPDDVAVIASWERVARAAARDLGRITVSAGRHGRWGRLQAFSQLLDEGAHSPARPGYADYRPDRHTMALAREYLRKRRPRFLWVALGDTDEYAHRGDYRGYLDALRSADRFVGEIWQLLGTMGAYGAETTILVTADHGRAADFVAHGEAPESARVWLLAGGGAVEPRGAIAAESTVHLRDIAPSARALLDLPADPSEDAGVPIAALLPPLLVTQARVDRN